jgi:predicted transcriptional regulator
MTDNVDLRVRREELGLSQEALATRAGTSLSYVRLVEKGYQPSKGGAAYTRILTALVDSNVERCETCGQRLPR